MRSLGEVSSMRSLGAVSSMRSLGEVSSMRSLEAVSSMRSFGAVSSMRSLGAVSACRLVHGADDKRPQRDMRDRHTLSQKKRKKKIPSVFSASTSTVDGTADRAYSSTCLQCLSRQRAVCMDMCVDMRMHVCMGMCIDKCACGLERTHACEETCRSNIASLRPCTQAWA